MRAAPSICPRRRNSRKSAITASFPAAATTLPAWPRSADGLKVAFELADPSLPTLVLETAQPAKFEETIVEALGRKPARPAGLENIEALPQRVEVMDVDAAAIKALIARTVDAA